MEAYELILRKLAIRDDAYIEFLQSSEEGSLTESTLESKARSLVRIAALAAIDATTPSYLEAVDSAREGGASDDEIVGVLIAIIPAVGVPRVVSAAPKLALALGLRRRRGARALRRLRTAVFTIGTMPVPGGGSFLRRSGISVEQCRLDWPESPVGTQARLGSAPAGSRTSPAFAEPGQV